MAVTRALRFSDYVTKRNGGSGDENACYRKRILVPRASVSFGHVVGERRELLVKTPRSNARACAMHSYPVAGRENFPRQNLIDTISESVSREKKLNDSD